MTHISRVPLDGSRKTEAISGMPQGYGAGMLSISSDGKTLATFAYPQNGMPKIAVFGLGSSSPPRMLDASHYSGQFEFDLQFSPDGKSLAYAIRENGVGQTYGCSRWTVPRAIRLPTSSQSKSGHSACRRMGKVSQFCAATMILTLFSSKNRSHEGDVQGFLTL